MTLSLLKNKVEKANELCSQGELWTAFDLAESIIAECEEKKLDSEAKSNKILLEAWYIINKAFTEDASEDEAIKYYKKALGNVDEMNHPIILFQLAKAFLRKGLQDKAVKNLTRALEIDPSLSEEELLINVSSEDGRSEILDEIAIIKENE